MLAARDAGCLAEVLVIASALSVPDPRERPLDKQQAADQAHLRFRDERSDFLSLLALWQFFADALVVEAARIARWSITAARISCRICACANGATCIGSSREQVRELGWKWPTGAENECLAARTIDDARYAAIHRALLAGLLSNIGTKRTDERRAYLGARGIRFYLHPGSGIAKKQREMGARRRADRNDAPVRALRGAHRARMDRSASPAICVERSLLRSALGPRRAATSSAPSASRCTGSRWWRGAASRSARSIRRPRAKCSCAKRWSPATSPSRRRSSRTTAELIEEIAELEHKARRQDVLVDDEAIVRVLRRARSGRGCIDRGVRALAARRGGARDPRLLFMTREALMRHAAAASPRSSIRNCIEMAAARLPLKYRFAPGHP